MIDGWGNSSHSPTGPNRGIRGQRWGGGVRQVGDRGGGGSGGLTIGSPLGAGIGAAILNTLNGILGGASILQGNNK